MIRFVLLGRSLWQQYEGRTGEDGTRKTERLVRDILMDQARDA